MRKLASMFGLVLSLILLPAATGAAQTVAQLPPEDVQKIEEAISAEMARQHLVGLSVAIAVEKRLVYANGFGMADLENSVPATARTVYRTASIAKPMTATGVLLLVEQGRLDLDAPIQKYCPAFPEKEWPVATRQLLGHLAGIRHYKSGNEATGTKHYFAIEPSLELFKDEPLLHEPGSKYQYSTYGYSVLGCALEGASGTSYAEFLHDQVFAPTGMSQTRTDDVYELIPHRARGYQKLDQRTYDQLPEAVKRVARVGAHYNADLHDTSMKVPGGGLVSTAPDLVRFALAYLDNSLLKEETKQRMWTRQRTKDGQETNYGLGWGVGDFHGLRSISHGGAQAGTRTFLGILPDKGIVVAFMCNTEGVDGGPLLEAIGAVLLGEQQPPNK